MAANNTSGILPAAAIRELLANGAIAVPRSVGADQVQPASLDLRLGNVAYRVRASFLPGPNRIVADRLKTVTLHEFSLADGAVLETGCVYIVPLMESLKLPANIAAAANPKSSTGRLDVFTRVITDRAREFDTIPAGYTGPLYLEVSPRTFPVLVRAGSRLSQMRFRRGEARLDDAALLTLHRKETLVAGEPNIANGITVTIDLAGAGDIVGYRAKRHTGVIDVDRRNQYDPADFWEPLPRHKVSELILDPDQFYILVSREAVHVPPDYAAEMVPFDPLVGEFRVHYAGFFDPGFGHSAAGGTGSRAVLEVRSHEVPFILEHGQVVGRLVYERLTARPDRLYGDDLGSNYQAQGLKLSKHFRISAMSSMWVFGQPPRGTDPAGSS
ncbi:MAG TPA: 2'-deoxycytidine 5'-triphosphate deaminase [Bauldia sp.]